MPWITSTFRSLSAKSSPCRWRSRLRLPVSVSETGEVRQLVARAQAAQQELHLDVGVDADHRDVQLRRVRGRVRAGGLEREPVQDLRLPALALAGRPSARPRAGRCPCALPVIRTSRRRSSSEGWNFGWALGALVPARSEVEDRVGVDVVDARTTALGEAGLAVRAAPRDRGTSRARRCSPRPTSRPGSGARRRGARRRRSRRGRASRGC